MRTPVGSRGQALVEFALVAPVFFILLFGIIEGGRFMLYYETLNNATREGARYAIVHGYNSACPSGPMPATTTVFSACWDEPGNNVIQRVKDTAFGVLGSSVTVTPTWVDGDNGRDQDIRVVATYTYRSLVPLVPLPPISITAESTLVINN
jgi:Flp pilus assembly protein TadG